MSRLMRMTYGHSGTKLMRILVSAPHTESSSAPRWLKVLLLVVWIVIPVLVSLYAVPTTTLLKTIIDVSKLDLKPLPEPLPPVIPEPPRAKPIEPPPPVIPEPPRAKPVEPPQKPLQQPPAEEVLRPSITRPTAPRVPDAAQYQPRIARERSPTSTESAAPPSTRIRRETAPGGAPPEKATSITRTRGAAAIDAPVATERVASLRRAPAAEGPSQGAGTLQPVTRSGRTSSPQGSAERVAPRISATRGSAQGTGAGGEVTSSIGLVRGISLASLEICSTPQKEEDDIRQVLSIVSSRQSCTDEKGEFQFKATKRISSFNLMIFPAKGRKPTNRCEELENAYRCLKTH